MKSHVLPIFAAVVAVSAACSSTPTGKGVVADAISAMGGDKLKAVQTVSMKGGAGTRTRLQQTRHVSDPEEPGTLSDVIEIVDLANGRASLDYQVKEGGFGQHRHEVLRHATESRSASSTSTCGRSSRRPLAACSRGALRTLRRLRCTAI